MRWVPRSAPTVDGSTGWRSQLRFPGCRDRSPTSWALEREIVLVRVLDSPRDSVFAAWTDPEAFCQWFGPDGFTCTVREMDVRPGGRACFDMAAADGTGFTNRFDYLEVVPSERLVMHHGTDVDDDPARFLVTITLDEQAEVRRLSRPRRRLPVVQKAEPPTGRRLPPS
jgi:uncharacterized protein YndB with AHSA1/START domain